MYMWWSGNSQSTSAQRVGTRSGAATSKGRSPSKAISTAKKNTEGKVGREKQVKKKKPVPHEQTEKDEQPEEEVASAAEEAGQGETSGKETREQGQEESDSEGTKTGDEQQEGGGPKGDDNEGGEGGVDVDGNESPDPATQDPHKIYAVMLERIQKLEAQMIQNGRRTGINRTWMKDPGLDMTIVDAAPALYPPFCTFISRTFVKFVPTYSVVFYILFLRYTFCV